MTEFTQTQLLVGSVALRVEIVASEFIEVANLHPDCESTFYVSGSLQQCTPQHGRPIPPGHVFRWDVSRSNTGQHQFFLCAVDDYDDQHASILAR